MEIIFVHDILKDHSFWDENTFTTFFIYINFIVNILCILIQYKTTASFIAV